MVTKMMPKFIDYVWQKLHYFHSEERTKKSKQYNKIKIERVRKHFW